MAAAVPTVLVTGASGYIASHIVQHLLQAGHKVRGTVRSLSNELKVKPLRELCPSAKYPLELVEADLLKSDDWTEVVDGCTYVLHTASPVPITLPKDELELITPAVEGTLSVLRACKEVSGVQRVVLTSSVAAVTGSVDNQATDAKYSEEDWTDPETAEMAYKKSKTLAEKAAWDFVREPKNEVAFELSVINPCIVLGPVISGGNAASLEIMTRLLTRAVPAVPHNNFCLVDVRDVAAAHVVAMTLPEAAGKRHILASHNMWLKDMAEVLKKEFGPLGYNVPTFVAPYYGVKLLSFFDKRLSYILKTWGRTISYDTTRMTSVLGIKPIPIYDTLLDMGYSMIDRGFIKKTSKYLKKKDES